MVPRFLAVFSVVAATVAMIAASSPASAARDCWCRYDGRSFLEGVCICMSTPAGVRRACCGRVLNNTSWSFSEGGCEMSQRPDTTSGSAKLGEGEPKESRKTQPRS